MASQKKIKDEETEQAEKALPLCYGHYRSQGQPDCPKMVICKYFETCFLDEIFSGMLT